MRYGTEQFFQQALVAYGIGYVANKTVTVTLARIFYENADPGQQNPFMLALDVALRADGRTQLIELTPKTQNSVDDPRLTSAVLGGFKSKAAEVRVPLVEGDKQIDLRVTGTDTDNGLCLQFLKAAHPQIEWSDEHVAYARYALYARLVYYCFVKDGMVETSPAVEEAVQRYGKLTGSSETLKRAISVVVGSLIKAMKALRDVISLAEYIKVTSDAVYAERCSELVGDVMARLLLRHDGPTVVRRVLFAVVTKGKYTMSTRMNKGAAAQSISQRVSVLFNNSEFDPTSIASYVQVLNNTSALADLEHVQNMNTAFLTEALRSSSARKDELLKAILTHPYAKPGTQKFEDACSQGPKDFFDADVFDDAQRALGCNVDAGGFALLDDASSDADDSDFSPENIADETDPLEFESESEPESDDDAPMDQGAEGGPKPSPSRKAPRDPGARKRAKTSDEQEITNQYIVNAMQQPDAVDTASIWRYLLEGAGHDKAQVLGDNPSLTLIRKALFNVQTPKTDKPGVTKALNYALNTKLDGVPLTPRLADALYALLPTPNPPEAKRAKADTASTVFLQRALEDYRNDETTGDKLAALTSMYEHEYRRSVGSASFSDRCVSSGAQEGIFKEVQSIVCSKDRTRPREKVDSGQADKRSKIRLGEDATKAEAQGLDEEIPKARRRNVGESAPRTAATNASMQITVVIGGDTRTLNVRKFDPLSELLASKSGRRTVTLMQSFLRPAVIDATDEQQKSFRDALQQALDVQLSVNNGPLRYYSNWSIEGDFDGIRVDKKVVLLAHITTMKFVVKRAA
jgi:hypothetical protein